MFVYEAILVSVCERAMENALVLPVWDLCASDVRCYERLRMSFNVGIVRDLNLLSKAPGCFSAAALWVEVEVTANMSILTFSNRGFGSLWFTEVFGKCFWASYFIFIHLNREMSKQAMISHFWKLAVGLKREDGSVFFCLPLYTSLISSFLTLVVKMFFDAVVCVIFSFWFCCMVPTVTIARGCIFSGYLINKPLSFVHPQHNGKIPGSHAPTNHIRLFVGWEELHSCVIIWRFIISQAVMDFKSKGFPLFSDLDVWMCIRVLLKRACIVT